jgi:hypothetical protein
MYVGNLVLFKVKFERNKSDSGLTGVSQNNHGTWRAPLLPTVHGVLSSLLLELSRLQAKRTGMLLLGLLTITVPLCRVMLHTDIIISLRIINSQVKGCQFNMKNYKAVKTPKEGILFYPLTPKLLYTLGAKLGLLFQNYVSSPLYSICIDDPSEAFTKNLLIIPERIDMTL